MLWCATKHDPHKLLWILSILSINASIYDFPESLGLVDGVRCFGKSPKQPSFLFLLLLFFFFLLFFSFFFGGGGGAFAKTFIYNISKQRNFVEIAKLKKGRKKS